MEKLPYVRNVFSINLIGGTMATGNKTTGWVPVLVDSISMVTATPKYSIGDRVMHKGDEYVYVYAKTATCPVGYGVCVGSNTTTTSYSVTITCITDVDNKFIGVVKHEDIEASEYGWAQTKGLCQIIAGNNTALSVDNQVIMASTTGTEGNMTRITDHTVYSQLAYTPRPVAGVITSGATNASATCLLYG